MFIFEFLSHFQATGIISLIIFSVRVDAVCFGVGIRCHHLQCDYVLRRGRQKRENEQCACNLVCLLVYSIPTSTQFFILL